MAYPPLMSRYFLTGVQMTTPIPTDLFNLKCQFEAWRKTRSKRTRTPDYLLKTAADLLDRYPASMICRICRINPRLLPRQTPSEVSSDIDAPSAPEFFPLSLTIPQIAFSDSHRQPQRDCQLVLERPDGARLSISLPNLNEAVISALCSNFLRSQDR